MIVVRPVAVPWRGIEKPAGCPLNDLHAVANIAVLREILINRELGKGKRNEHALDRRHAEEGKRLARTERLDDDTHEIGGVLFLFGNTVP